MARAGIVLSGCGNLDGCEIHESVCIILALQQQGFDVIYCAPDIPQAHVVNFVTTSPMIGETRNVLLESARIARSDIVNIADISADDIDVLVFPGGQGASRNLSTFANDGTECKVNVEVERLIGQMLDAGKPVGAICIAPAMLARVLGNRGVQAKVTIGTDAKVAAQLQAMGVCHVDCPADQVVVDEQYKIVTTPAYMLADNITQVFAGCTRMAEELARLM